MNFNKGMTVLASNSLPASGPSPHPPMIDRAVEKVAFSGTQLHVAGHVFFLIKIHVRSLNKSTRVAKNLDVVPQPL